VTFGLDGTFSEKSFITRFNGDLANDLGNLLNRTLTMVEKYFKGAVPKKAQMQDADKELEQELANVPVQLNKFIPELNFNQALASIWKVVKKANKYIEDSAPWQLSKDNETERLEAVFYVLLKVLSHSVFFLYPFMPDASMEIARQLGMDISEEEITFSNLKDDILKPGTKVKKGHPIFPRII